MTNYKVGDLVKVTRLIGADSKRGIVVGHIFEVTDVRQEGVTITPPIPLDNLPHIMYYRQIELYDLFGSDQPETIQDTLQARLDELDDEILQHALARDEHKRQLKIKKKMQKAYADVMFDLKRKDDSDAE